MYWVISFLMAVAPSLFLVWFFYRQDRLRPEPRELIARIFVYGILSVFPIVLLEVLLTGVNMVFAPLPVLFFLFRSYVVAGFSEEFIKLQVVKRYAYSDIHFDEETDGIIYAIVASLGFACLENVIYVLNTDWATAFARAVTAVPMHALSSGIMGYYVGKAKFAGDKESERKLFKEGLWKAILWHGTYNFVLFLAPIIGSIFSFLIFPIMYKAYQNLKADFNDAFDDDLSSGRV